KRFDFARTDAVELRYESANAYGCHAETESYIAGFFAVFARAVTEESAIDRPHLETGDVLDEELLYFLDLVIGLDDVCRDELDSEHPTRQGPALALNKKEVITSV